MKHIPNERIGQNTRKRTKLNGDSNLLDTDFKTLVIRLLNEFRARIDELSKNLHKETETIKKKAYKK